MGLPGSGYEPNVHGTVTRVQTLRGGGTFSAETRITYRALRHGAGATPAQARVVVWKSARWFKRRGFRGDTPTTIPQNRVNDRI